MAVQDFVSGGFYGKVGQLVGQRWKNKRTVRSYVIPHNPRTLAQQSNRERFTSAVKYAQLGLIFNKGAPMWRNERMTEYQWRMSIAKKRVDRGIEDWNAVPLYPDGSVPDISILDVKREGQAEGTLVLSSETVALQEVSRRLFIQLCLFNQETEKFELVNVVSITKVGSANIVSETLPLKYKLSEGVSLMGITTDDSEHEEKFWYIPPQEAEVGERVVIDDLVAEYVGEDYIAFSSVKSGVLQQSYGLSVQLVCWNACTEQTERLSLACDTEVSGQHFFNLPLSWFYSCAKASSVSAVVTRKEEGAVNLTIPEQAFTLAIREVRIPLTSGETALNTSDRQEGVVSFDLPKTFKSLDWTIETKHYYTDFMGGDHSGDDGHSQSGRITESKEMAWVETFESCPMILGSQLVAVDFQFANDYISSSVSDSAAIVDTTQTIVSVDGWVNKRDGDWITIFAPLSGSTYSQFVGKSFGASVRGQSIMDGSEVELPIQMTCEAGRNFEDMDYYLAIECREVYPNTNGLIVPYQTDFRTDSHPIGFRPTPTSLGKIRFLGMDASLEYVAIPLELSNLQNMTAYYRGNCFEITSGLATRFSKATAGGLTVVGSDGTEKTVVDITDRTSHQPGTEVSLDLYVVRPLAPSVTEMYGSVFVENAMIYGEGEWSWE